MKSGEVRRWTEKRGEGTENVVKAISRELKKERENQDREYGN